MRRRKADEVVFEAVQQYRSELTPLGDLGGAWADAHVVVFLDEVTACEYARRTAERMPDWQRVVVVRVTRESVHACRGEG